MARLRRPLDPHGRAAQVYQQLKREPAGWRRERLLAVKLGLEAELGLEQIAAPLGRARSCIQRWLDLFRHGGLEGLLQPPRRGQGPASQLTPELAEALRQKVAAGAFRRAADAHRWLTQAHGLRIGLATVYTYLKKSRRAAQSPAPLPPKKGRVGGRSFPRNAGRAPAGAAVTPGAARAALGGR